MKKRCFKCLQVLPVEDFYSHPAMADGRLGKCKGCTKGDVRSNYRAHIDRYKVYEKGRANLPHRVDARRRYARTDRGREVYTRLRQRYASTEHGRIATQESKVRWIRRNPEKRKAQVTAGNAIRDGRLVKQPCEVCGATAQVHHDDYSKPLDVRWLCATHHGAHHAAVAAKRREDESPVAA